MLAGALLAFSFGCGAVDKDEPQSGARDERPLLGFGVIAGDDPGLTYKGYQPLIDRLTDQTPFLFRLSLGRNTDDMLLYLEERMAEVVPLDVVSYLEAHSQFGAVPLVKSLNQEGAPVSQSIFLVREESPIESLADLKDQRLALGSFHSTLGNLVPTYELARTGIEADDLGDVEHLDDDEAVVTALLEGRFDAGAVEARVGYRFRDQGLRVVHVSDPMPSRPLAVRGDLPSPVVAAVRDALLSLKFEDSQKREGWGEDIRYGFVAASDADYDIVREKVSRVSERCGGSCHSRILYGDQRAGQ